jgi:hypothetical protein
MSALLVGAEITVSICAFALAIVLIWIAKPRGPEPKFAFLKSETGQVVYTVFCISLIAIGFSLGFHGLTGG